MSENTAISLRPKRRTAGGFSLSGGECPICGRRFKDFSGLELHASECSIEAEGPIAPQRPLSRQTKHQHNEAVVTRQTKIKRSVVSKAFVSKCLKKASKLYKHARKLRKQISET